MFYTWGEGKREKEEDREREREKERERKRGCGRKKGKERKLINSNHRALIPQRAKDRPARLRLTASATASFVTRGEKPPESHVRAEWRQPAGFLAPGFPGVSTD